MFLVSYCVNNEFDVYDNLFANVLDQSNCDIACISIPNFSIRFDDMSYYYKFLADPNYHSSEVSNRNPKYVRIPAIGKTKELYKSYVDNHIDNCEKLGVDKIFKDLVKDYQLNFKNTMYILLCTHKFEFDYIVQNYDVIKIGINFLRLTKNEDLIDSVGFDLIVNFNEDNEIVEEYFVDYFLKQNDFLKSK